MYQEFSKHRLPRIPTQKFNVPFRNPRSLTSHKHKNKHITDNLETNFKWVFTNEFI